MEDMIEFVLQSFENTSMGLRRNVDAFYKAAVAMDVAWVERHI